MVQIGAHELAKGSATPAAAGFVDLPHPIRSRHPLLSTQINPKAVRSSSSLADRSSGGGRGKQPACAIFTS